MDHPSQEIRVLVVEDSPLSRKLVEHALAEPHYKIEFAMDGREAMAAFTRKTPDIVTTDWELPDTTGPELCRRFRKLSSLDSYTYLLLLTSNADKKSLSEGLAAGADDYVTKPFDAEELRARVGVGRRLVEMHRELQEKTRLLLIEARTSSLTGLPNARAIEEWAVRQLAGATRHGYPFWVVLAELESHRYVNDLLGRAAGDAMIRSFAEVLKSTIRASDMFGHLGGPQFILVLTHVEKDHLALLLDRLRARLEARPYTLDRSTTPMLATFGAAVSTKSAPLDWPSLMCQADAALVEAKRSAGIYPLAETLKK